MRNIYYIILLIIVIVTSCKNEKALEKFEIPQIIQLDTHDTVEYANTNSINGIYAIVVGKYKFSNTFKIHFDSLWKYCSFDTSDISDISSSQYRKSECIKSDNSDMTGFRLVTDYNTDIGFRRNSRYDKYHHVFPIYIINDSEQTKTLLGKESWVFALQEAKNRHGVWQLIEEDGLDGCGNGYWRLQVHPKEFVMFLMNKYSGDFQTSLRIKLRVGQCEYVSEPYTASISEKQFLPFHYPQ